MRDLWAVIGVGWQGESAGPVRQVLGGVSLLARAVWTCLAVEPSRIVLSVPAATGWEVLARSAGAIARVHPQGHVCLESVLDQLLADPGPAPDGVLVLDPQRPLLGAHRLLEARDLARRHAAGCVFTCHREAAPLWQASPMGLVPYFDPASRRVSGDHADHATWLCEDGSLYLLRVADYLEARQRHCGRVVPLELSPREAVVADGPSGMAMCRALLCTRESDKQTAD